MQKNAVLIMAGGAGTRFWPSSRQIKPKQFLDFLGTGKTLLQATFERAKKLAYVENIHIATIAEYTEIIKHQLPDLIEENIIIEPCRNNTGPCIAYASWKLDAKSSFDDLNLVVLPSDHYIMYEDIFVDALRKGINHLSKSDAIVTLGITPKNPNTGYGYIQKAKQLDDDCYKVEKFCEKPNEQKAKEYLASGDFFWNAGVFLAKTSTLKAAFRRHTPEIANVFEEGNTSFNTQNEDAFITTHYGTCPNISVDYAIMEKYENIAMIPTDCGWTDLGTWASLHQVADKDCNNNMVHAENGLFLDVSDSVVIEENVNKKVIVRGLENFLVIDQKDVLLIYPKSKEQEIKHLTGLLYEQGESSLL